MNNVLYESKYIIVSSGVWDLGRYGNNVSFASSSKITNQSKLTKLTNYRLEMNKVWDNKNRKPINELVWNSSHEKW